MAQYTWLTMNAAITALQGRLQSSVFWTTAELTVYINEACRLWNALTEQWRQEFTFTSQGCQWVNLGTLAGSPRLRSVTDANLYTQMQYMLLEPPTGAGAWTGTAQFDLASLQSSLQKRRDELIQATFCNLTQLAPLATTPNTRRTYLPDTVLEPHRNRFLGLMATTTGTASSGAQIVAVGSTIGVSQGYIITGTNIPAGAFVTSVTGTNVSISLPTTGTVTGNVQFFVPVTLTREDTQSFQYFQPNYLQTSGFPQSWSIASELPLAFDVDNAPNIPGTFDMIALQSGPTFAPPAATLLGVPDDWSMLPMYGALADLLNSDPERTDRARADYCLKKFLTLTEAMKRSNWLVQATVNGVACNTPALFDQDSYRAEWQASVNTWPSVVQAGMDFVAPCPGTSQGVSLTLVGNQYIPTSGTDYIQVSRDVFDVILDYSQRVAMFKEAGEEWQGAQSLEDNFYRAAQETNKRLLNLGIFTDILNKQGQKELEVVPR
jgi:hypothetical protein